jgi:hypothetical protein
MHFPPPARLQHDTVLDDGDANPNQLGSRQADPASAFGVHFVVVGELIKYAIAHFRGFTPLDYLLLIIVGSLLIAGAIAVLRWLFESRYKAQQDLLELRAALVSAVQQQVELASAEAARLRAETDEYKLKADEAQRERERLDGIVRDMTNASERAAQYHEDVQAVSLLSANALLMVLRLVQLYQMLSLYQRFLVTQETQDAPTPESLFARLQSLFHDFRRVANMFQAVADSHGKTPAPIHEVLSIEQMFSEASRSELDELWNIMLSNLEAAVGKADTV